MNVQRIVIAASLTDQNSFSYHESEFTCQSLILFLQYDHSLNLSALPFLFLANVAILCLAVMKLVFSPAILFIFIVQYSEEW